MIPPHGGKLIHQVLNGEGRERTLKKASRLPKIVLSEPTLRDAENIATGVFSPLQGFMNQPDVESVLNKMRLTQGAAWTIPMVLDVDASTAQGLAPGDEVILTDPEGKSYALFHLEEKYRYDKDEFAQKVFGVVDEKHPGVKRVRQMGEVLLGGKIELIERLPMPFDNVRLDPAETRLLFQKKGWKTVAAFQTRNVPHLGHENIQKTVLSLVDGLLIQPVIGKKKSGDFQDHLIIKTYQILIEKYFAKERVVLSILPTEMRYAGPREAIFHAIVRKNYGCTHFVVGRDHAGVGNYYPPEAAIEIFKEFDDLAIQPITVRGDFFHCNYCNHLASERTCPHDDRYKIFFSGTEIRRLLVEGQKPPIQMMRPEVAEVILQDENPFVN